MTIIHDLTLSPEARRERRLSNLEQGYISNQQSGAWAKNVGVTAITENGTEAGVTVNGLVFTIPAYGQYDLSLVMDAAATASGYAQGYILIAGIGNTFATYVSPQALRGTITSQYAGFLEPGVVLTGKIARIGGAGNVAAYGGSMIVRKIA